MTEQRMTSAEAVQLCRMAKAACPQQQFDQYTPDMWHELLGDLLFTDAKAALVAVVQRQPFVAPAEIREQVHRIRDKRILEFGYVVPPPELADNPAAEQCWLYATRQAIADGVYRSPEEMPTYGELLDREMPDWDRMLPAPPPVSRAVVVAETKRAKDPNFDANLARARDELAGRREIPMRGDVDTEGEEAAG